MVDCNPGFGDCDGIADNGCETNLLTDTSHCGARGADCPAPANATPICTAGTCAFTCTAGFADCDGNAANGCEVDLRSDPTRCGTCSTVCNPPNGTPACVMGACAVAACATGFGDCDRNATNGCETDVRRSTGNCGGCGRACEERANAFPGCLAGACVTSCVMGFQDCNGVEADGCEADLRVSVANCGSCGRACNPSNATGVCASGVCTVARCDAGFADCNGNAADGCEVNLQSDPNRCASCSTVCTVPNGTPACVAGVCGLATCGAGRGDCDRMVLTGCEVDLTTDPRNCGACGNACTAEQHCVAGQCCAGDRICGRQCVDVSRDARHCGGCGQACATGAACLASRCVAPQPDASAPAPDVDASVSP